MDAGPFLHERFPELRERLPFARLGEGPSPVRRLDGLDAGGAEVWVKDEGAYGGPWAALPWLLARHASPLPPYLLPAGGSSPVGALGYVETAFELAAQVEAGELPEPACLARARREGSAVDPSCSSRRTAHGPLGRVVGQLRRRL